MLPNSHHSSDTENYAHSLYTLLIETILCEGEYIKLAFFDFEGEFISDNLEGWESPLCRHPELVSGSKTQYCR